MYVNVSYVSPDPPQPTTTTSEEGRAGMYVTNRDNVSLVSQDAYPLLPRPVLVGVGEEGGWGVSERKSDRRHAGFRPKLSVDVPELDAPEIGLPKIEAVGWRDGGGDEGGGGGSAPSTVSYFG